MPIVTLKNKLALPEIGFVRKGAPKNEKGQLGRDLGAAFRVGFFPGNEEAEAKFKGMYQSLNPKEVKIVLPFSDVDSNWDCWYEAYTAGRMIARADGEKFIRKVNMKTGAVEVHDGLPYTPFNKDEPLWDYINKKGEKAYIYARMVGRLKFVLPALGRPATMTLHTTSIYDVVHITEQLNAINEIARRCGASLAGCELILTRRFRDVTWVQDGGKAVRTPKSLVHIEANPEWFEKIMRRMSAMALPEGLQAAMLPGGENENAVTVSGHDRQAEEDLEKDFDEEGFEDGDFTEEPGGLEEAAEALGGVIVPPEEEQKPQNGNGFRPYSPEQLKLRIEALRMEFESRNGAPSREQRNMIAPNMEMLFVGQDGPDQLRHTVLKYLLGKSSTKDLTSAEVLAIRKWLDVREVNGEWLPSEMAVKEAQSVLTAALEVAGQQRLI